MKLRIVVLVVAMAFAGAVHALAVIEFMEMKGSGQYDAVKPIMVSFLKAGYKKVPDNEFIFISEIKKLAYEKGYTFQNLEDVAKEAAMRMGMTR